MHKDVIVVYWTTTFWITYWYAYTTPVKSSDMFTYRNSLYFILLFDIALMGITHKRLVLLTRKWKENCVSLLFGKVIISFHLTTEVVILLRVPNFGNLFSTQYCTWNWYLYSSQIKETRSEKMKHMPWKRPFFHFTTTRMHKISLLFLHITERWASSIKKDTNQQITWQILYSKLWRKYHPTSVPETNQE